MSKRLIEKEVENSPEIPTNIEILEFSATDNKPIAEDKIETNSKSAKPVTRKNRLLINSLIVFGVTIIATVIIGVVLVNVKPADTTEEAQEIATGTVVPATDESINFAKSNYNIEVGKKVKVSCTYTPPIDKYKQPQPYITYISENPEIAKVDSKGNIVGVSTGATNITALADTGIYTTVPITVTAPKSHIIEDVPMLTQNYYYPSGCESVSTTMLLNYYGYKLEPSDFIDKYLPMGYFTYNDNGEMLGPDTSSVFIGSPYSESALGCYPPVIEHAVNKYVKNKNHRALNVTGASMGSLIRNYIANNQPVLIWATMYMWEPFVTYEWTVAGAESYSPYKDGDTCQWLANEHCMVLTGYDEDYYYFNDPLYYYDSVAYSREIFDQRYKQIGMCALVLDKIK